MHVVNGTNCHASHQEVNRCRTADEIREFIACRRQSTQVRHPPWLWNPGETSPEVQNRGISGPTKRIYVLQKLKKNLNKDDVLVGNDLKLRGSQICWNQHIECLHFCSKRCILLKVVIVLTHFYNLRTSRGVQCCRLASYGWIKWNIHIKWLMLQLCPYFVHKSPIILSTKILLDIGLDPMGLST